MDVEVPVHAGYLIVPTQTGFSLNRISKKKSSNHKYCLLFKSSRHGIERIEICDKDDLKNPKIITLENCVKITQEPAPANIINIVTKTGTLTLNASSEDDLKEWVAAFQSVAFKDKSGTLSRQSAIEEDNDLYCTSYSDGIFTIKLMFSDISVKCNLEAKTYLLHLTATELQLKNIDDNSIVVSKWPYRYIRKYGYRDGKFTFEAGRKCDTGEGVFSLEHSNPQKVFKCMGDKMKSMKKLINGDSIANLDCGEHQFNAALSMEAGSRSPLPPSPNHHSHAAENELNQSGHLIRGFLSSNDSLNNVSTSSSSIPIIKHIPNKPPRKTIALIDNNERIDRNFDGRISNPQKYSKFQNYDPVLPPLSTEKSGIIVLKTPPAAESNKSFLTLIIPNESSNEKPPELPVRNESKNCEDRDYECIETITNAWKTRGIDDVKHTEHITTPEENLSEFVWQRSQSQINSNSEFDRKLLSPVRPDCDPAIEDYDRLQFFTTNTKTSSDYKTIVTVTPPGYKKQISQPITSNDYEIIGAPDISPCRLADDSYMGYGMIRKPNVSPTQAPTTMASVLLSDDELLDHRQFNGLDYAIVSKPKRV